MLPSGEGDQGFQGMYPLRNVPSTITARMICFKGTTPSICGCWQQTRNPSFEPRLDQGNLKPYTLNPFSDLFFRFEPLGSFGFRL